MSAARHWMACIVTVFALLLAGPAAAGLVELQPGAGELALSPHVTYFHDTGGSASSSASAAAFQALQGLATFILTSTQTRP